MKNNHKVHLRFIHWLVAVSFLSVPVSSALASYDSAVSAYKRGEYIQALKELFSFTTNKNADVEYQKWKQQVEALGLPEQYNDIIPWLEKQATQGSAEAQYYLGIMYRDGLGVTKNPQLAQQWLEKAAAQGFGSAQYDLGLMQMGTGDMPTDYKSAMEWLEKSARQGNSNAMIYMGKFYAEGLGVQPDIIMAYAWLSLAEQYITENDGKQLIQQSRQALSRQMTQEQIQAAEQAVSMLKQHMVD